MTTVYHPGIGPLEKLAFGLDFSNRLSPSATVASAVWSAEAGDGVQTLLAYGVTGTIASLTVVGGTAGTVYDWLCVATASTGEIHQETLRLPCFSK